MTLHRVSGPLCEILLLDQRVAFTFDANFIGLRHDKVELNNKMKMKESHFSNEISYPREFRAGWTDRKRSPGIGAFA
jgi:hypothetical protein